MAYDKGQQMKLLYGALQDALDKVASIEKAIRKAESELINEVKFVKNGDTITLTHGDTVYKLTKNARGRYKIMDKNRKTVCGDSLLNVNMIRLRMALGDDVTRNFG